VKNVLFIDLFIIKLYTKYSANKKKETEVQTIQARKHTGK